MYVYYNINERLEACTRVLPQKQNNKFTIKDTFFTKDSQIPAKMTIQRRHV